VKLGVTDKELESVINPLKKETDFAAKVTVVDSVLAKEKSPLTAEATVLTTEVTELTSDDHQLLLCL